MNIGTASFSHCTIFGNKAFSGSAILNQSGTLNLMHCTVSGNHSSGGSGSTIFNNTEGTVNVANCIIAENTAVFLVADVFNRGTLNFAGRNILKYPIRSQGGTITGSSTISYTAPLLAPLDNYGGPTKTLALLRGSPARNGTVGSAATNDQRGFPIVSTPDIGAYEAGTLAPNFNAFVWETLPATATVPQHASTFDFDGDSVTNFNEWLALTDAANPSDYLRPPQITFSSGILYVTVPTALGRHYSLESKTDLGDSGPWRFVPGSSFAGTGATVSVPIAPFFEIPSYFVRVIVGP